MRFSRTNAFKRLYRKLPAQRQEAVNEALARFDKMLQIGLPMAGLGLKELKAGIWEIRAGLLDRIVFARSKDEIEFLIVGTHDEIRRFLRRF